MLNICYIYIILYLIYIILYIIYIILYIKYNIYIIYIINIYNTIYEILCIIYYMLNIINNITYIFYKTYLSPLPKPYLWTAPLKTPTTWRLAVSFRSCLDIAHGGKKGISVVNHGKSPRKTSCKKHWIICVYIYLCTC